MKELESITAAINATRSINKNWGLDSPMMKMITAQRELQDKLMPFRNHEIFNTVARIQKMMPRYEESGIMTMIKNIRSASDMMPSGAMTAIMAIQRQNQHLFSSTRSILDALPAQAAFSHVNSLQYALSGITKNIAAIAAANRDWSLVDDFEEISSQAIELTDHLSAHVALSEEENAAFQSLIQYVVSIIKKHRKFGIYSLLFIDMVLRVASFHQYFDFLKSKPELATKEDVGKFEKKLLQSIREKLKEEQEYRLTNRACKVYLKPKFKSLKLITLPVKFEVIVLQINHKWAYISYIDPTDNVSQTGWVPKKFLTPAQGH